MRLIVRNFLCVAVAVFVWVPAALAQSSDKGCVLEQVAGTSRQVLRCQDGLDIVVEDGAAFTLVDRDRDGNADAIRLRRKAVLLDGPQVKDGTGFQVVTPQAIAAVRGTKWAVDVAAGRHPFSSSAEASRYKDPRQAPVCSWGQARGWTSAQEMSPLTVRRWPAARVAALMARFGQ